jgi:hypothetical protein
MPGRSQMLLQLRGRKTEVSKKLCVANYIEQATGLLHRNYNCAVLATFGINLG